MRDILLGDIVAVIAPVEVRNIEEAGDGSIEISVVGR